MTRPMIACALVAVLPIVQAATGASIEWPAVVAAYARVQDYTATYEKVERAIDRGAPQTIRLSFRKPFDVRMDWLDHGRVDQTAVYRRGQNDGKLRARRSGLLGGLIGVVNLDPRDARAMADSRHPITEVGIGHLIDAIGSGLSNATLMAAPAAAEPLDGVVLERLEFASAGRAAVAGIVDASRVSVWVDRALLLPVRVDVIDAAGTLIERHRYRELRVNVGLADAVFTL